MARTRQSEGQSHIRRRERRLRTAEEEHLVSTKVETSRPLEQQDFPSIAPDYDLQAENQLLNENATRLSSTSNVIGSDNALLEVEDSDKEETTGPIHAERPQRPDRQPDTRRGKGSNVTKTHAMDHDSETPEEATRTRRLRSATESHQVNEDGSVARLPLVQQQPLLASKGTSLAYKEKHARAKPGIYAGDSQEQSSRQSKGDPNPLRRGVRRKEQVVPEQPVSIEGPPPQPRRFSTRLTRRSARNRPLKPSPEGHSSQIQGVRSSGERRRKTRTVLRTADPGTPDDIAADSPAKRWRTAPGTAQSHRLTEKASADNGSVSFRPNEEVAESTYHSRGSDVATEVSALDGDGDEAAEGEADHELEDVEAQAGSELEDIEAQAGSELEDIEEQAGDDHAQDDVESNDDNEERLRGGSEPDFIGAEGTFMAGRRKHLEAILDAVANVGVPTINGVAVKQDLELKSEPVKQLDKLVRRAAKCYTDLRRNSGLPRNAREEIRENLAEYAQLYRDNVRSLEEGGETEQDRTHKVQDIYAFALPAFVNLLREALRYHDGNPQSNAQNLREVIEIINVMTTLHDKVTKWHPRPDTKLKIVGPHRNVVIPRTRALRKMFSNELKAIEEREREDREREERLAETRDMEATLEQDNLRHQQAILERRRIIQQELEERRRSFAARISAAPGGDKRWTGATAQPSSSRSVPSPSQPRTRPAGSSGSTDRGGEAADREQVRAATTTPEHQTTNWTDEEQVALIRGLEQFHGQGRFDRIFEEYNPIGKPLAFRDREEVEIKAHELKVGVLEDMERHPDGGILPPWLASV